MTKAIDNLLQVRQVVFNAVKDLSAEALNKVPAGFNNNVVWNLGHLVTAQQGICYLRSGVNPRVEEKYLAPYRPGTKPEGTADNVEIKRIKDALFSSLDMLKPDVESNLFVNYTPWITRYGVHINSIDDALSFLLFHEGLHFGYILSLKKFV